MSQTAFGNQLAAEKAQRGAAVDVRGDQVAPKLLRRVPARIHESPLPPPRRVCRMINMPMNPAGASAYAGFRGNMAGVSAETGATRWSQWQFAAADLFDEGNIRTVEPVSVGRYRITSDADEGTDAFLFKGSSLASTASTCRVTPSVPKATEQSSPADKL